MANEFDDIVQKNLEAAGMIDKPADENQPAQNPPADNPPPGQENPVENPPTSTIESILNPEFTGGGEQSPGEKPPTETDENKPQPVDLKKLNAWMGTEFESEDQLSTFKEKMSAIQDIQKAQEEVQSLKMQAVDPFATDELRNMNAFIKETGINDLTVYNEISKAGDVSKMEDIDAIMLARILKNPTYAQRKDLLKRSIEKQYNIDDDTLEPEDLELNKFSMSGEADQARREIAEVMGKVNPQSREEYLQQFETQRTERTNQWSGVMPRISKFFESYAVRGSDDFTKDPIATIQNSPEQIKPYLDQAVQYAVNNNLELNEANLKQVLSFAEMSWWYANRHSISYSIAKSIRNAETGKTLEEIHHPSGTPEGKPGASPSDNNIQEVLSAVKKDIGAI